MKRFLLALVIVLAFCSSVYAEGLEGSFKWIFAKSDVSFTQDTVFGFEKELGVNLNGTLKELTFTSLQTRNMKFEYSAQLPVKATGDGSLLSRIRLGGLTFGPKDANDTEAKNRRIYTEYSVQKHRFTLTLFTSEPLFSPVLFGEYDMYGLTLRGKPAKISTSTSSTGGSSQQQDENIVEVSDNARKFLLGGGLCGFYRERAVLIRYEAVITYVDQKVGGLADILLRYDTPQYGFVGVGYRYQSTSFTFNGDWQIKTHGPYVEVGLRF